MCDLVQVVRPPQGRAGPDLPHAAVRPYVNTKLKQAPRSLKAWVKHNCFSMRTHITASPRESALLVKKDIADLLVSGELAGEVRRMSCKSKVGKTMYIAKAGTQTLIGQVTVESCTPISDEEFHDLYQKGIFGSCGTPDPTKTKQRYLWTFSKPLRFETPRPYTHPQGAQIWVNITA